MDICFIFLFGVVMGMTLTFVWLSPHMMTVFKLCDEKWGVQNWTSTVQGGYFYCKPNNVSNPPFDGWNASRWN